MPKKTYAVTEIWVNGERLAAKDFSALEWDQLMLPLTLFPLQATWNSHLYGQEISRLTGAKDSSLYINAVSQEEFDAWYRERVKRIAGIKDNNADIQYHTVIYTHHFNRLSSK